MTAINVYATLADLKAFKRTGGVDLSADTTDDTVMVDLLNQASRYLDDATWRQFYPSYELRYFSLPWDDELWFDDDLLEIVSFTNGNDTAIASSAYHLLPKNKEPKYALRLIATSNVVWEADSSGNTEFVLDLTAWWGYHKDYTRRGWSSGGTLGAAISDTTALTFTMTAGHSLVVGQIVKIDTELMIVTNVATNTITANARGDNGSTAATHSNGATVYIWNPDVRAKQAVLEIANGAYHRRFGTNLAGGAVEVTAAGVVITPQDINSTARGLIEQLRRRS